MPASAKKAVSHEARLRDLGRRLAEEHLRQSGFLNLREARDWATWATFEGERDGKRYAIAVMTRNHLQAGGAINGSYNLPKTPLQKTQLKRLKADPDVEPAFVCVAINPEAGRYSAYLGLVSSVGDLDSVPMRPADLDTYEALVFNRSHPEITPDLSNADR